MKVLILLLSAIFMSGCGVWSQKFMLSEKKYEISNVVTINDLRDEESKNWRLGSRDNPSRWYGDSNFVPDRISYLSKQIELKLMSDVPVAINLYKFEVVEYIPKTVERSMAYASAGATSSIPGVVYTGNPFTDGEGKHDSLVLMLDGTIGDKPFKFSLSSRTDEIKFFNFPHENPEFHELTRKMFSIAADKIVNIYKSKSQDDIVVSYK